MQWIILLKIGEDENSFIKHSNYYSYVMKKKFLFASLFLSAIIFPSCQKEYQCHCYTSSGTHDHFTLKAKDQDGAEAQCTAKEIGVYESCDIE
jgi:hypothetical protein